MKSQNKNHDNDFVVTRKLKALAPPKKWEDISKELTESKQLLNINKKNKNIIITYDASTISIDQIITIFVKNGIEIKKGFWVNLIIGWYRFVDKNIHDNARHKPHCCNKAPKS